MTTQPTPCPDCARAEQNPDWGGYRAHCPECHARALAQSPAFFYSQNVRRLTHEYQGLLAACVDKDIAVAHERVKAWAERIQQTRQRKRAAQ
ncbi:MAG: hypothetical protein LBH10_06770 [Burkholderiaceae bacterium]|jgi:hypothetical protein|nr:hypothetical protein [Burkholderiaceae bacterium]